MTDDKRNHEALFRHAILTEISERPLDSTVNWPMSSSYGSLPPLELPWSLMRRYGCANLSALN